MFQSINIIEYSDVNLKLSFCVNILVVYHVVNIIFDVLLESTV